jgi:hypothetical protein
MQAASTSRLARVALHDCPVVASAVGAVCSLLQDAEIEAESILGAADATDLIARCPTPADLVAAGLIDDADLGRVHEAIGDADERRVKACGGLAGLCDRFLVPVIVRGLAQRVAAAGAVPERLRPAVAARVMAEAWPAVLSLDLAPEVVLVGPGCHLDPRVVPWLPAGHTLARAVGLEALIAAAAGVVPWTDAIDDHLQRRAIARLPPCTALNGPAQAEWGRQDDDEDILWLEHAVGALTARRRLVHGLPRGVGFVPDGGLAIDARACCIGLPGPVPALATAASEGWLDAPLHRLTLPPSLCAGLDRAGWHGVHLHLDATDGIEDLIDLLLDIALLGVQPETIEGEGFTVSPMGAAPANDIGA